MKWLIFLTWLLALDAYAFNWSKCSKKLDPFSSYVGFDAIPKIFSSTSSYVSSTGPCAMIGQVEQDQKLFLAFNLDKIKIDSARGGGEYLEAYAQIAQMSKLDQQEYFAKVQKNYSFIFKDEDLDGIFNRINL